MSFFRLLFSFEHGLRILWCTETHYLARFTAHTCVVYGTKHHVVRVDKFTLHILPVLLHSLCVHGKRNTGDELRKLFRLN